jgi:hypothetical protein
LKKVLIFFMVLIALFVITNLAGASEATKVDDAYKPYTADQWIISPDEEPIDDQKVENAPECDIRGVASCYDDTYLRVDIFLKTGVSFKWDILYGICLEYEDMNEYYIYYTDSKKLIYQKEKNGKIVETRNLTEDGAGDTAGVTNSGDVENGDIYFIINKSDHIKGEKGKNYFIPSYFYSGYINEKGTTNIADQTIDKDLEFEY